MTSFPAPKKNSQGRCYCRALSIDYARELESVVGLKLRRNSQARKMKDKLRGKGKLNEGVEAAIFSRTLRQGIRRVSSLKVEYVEQLRKSVPSSGDFNALLLGGHMRPIGSCHWSICIPNLRLINLRFFAGHEPSFLWLWIPQSRSTHISMLVWIHIQIYVRTACCDNS